MSKPYTLFCTLDEYKRLELNKTNLINSAYEFSSDPNKYDTIISFKRNPERSWLNITLLKDGPKVILDDSNLNNLERSLVENLFNIIREELHKK